MKDPFEIYTNLSEKKTLPALDWEESAADSQSQTEAVFDEARIRPSARWLYGLLLICLVLAMGRLFFLQILKGQNFRALSENNRIRKQPLLAPRGLIFDRFGQPLAENVAGYNLVAVPADLPKESLAEELNKLASIFGLDENELMAKIAAARPDSIYPVLIKQSLSPEESILFKTRASEFLGFLVQEVPIRRYLYPYPFAHILGYTGVISSEDLRKSSARYQSYDFAGKFGIEQQYENFLLGQNGSNLIEVDAAGRLLNVLGEDSPKPGRALALNLDAALQNQLYEKLKSKSGRTKRAAAVALNPKTGEVLALLSLPGFDPNLFVRGISAADYQALLSDKNLPLFNRAVAGLYPPGSTVKPMVAAAALEEKIVNEKTIIRDRGVLVIPNQYNPKLDYNFFGWKREGLGPVDVRLAIALSSDIYFYIVSGGHPNSPIDGLGPEKLDSYYRKFNLGRLTGIDLQGEKPGLVPNPKWKAEYYKNDPILKRWYLGDTYHIGIGQGDMLATPLQVAEWTAIIANGGKGFKPRILSKVLDENGQTIFENKPEILVDNFLSQKSVKIVQEGMRQTVLEGSARQLNDLSISSAGKTGTSQFDGSNPSRTHAWFTVYAPFEDPEIVITVLVEAGGEGHAVAVPVVKEVLKWWAENRYEK